MDGLVHWAVPTNVLRIVPDRQLPACKIPDKRMSWLGSGVDDAERKHEERLDLNTNTTRSFFWQTPRVVVSC